MKHLDRACLLELVRTFISSIESQKQAEPSFIIPALSYGMRTAERFLSFESSFIIIHADAWHTSSQPCCVMEIGGRLPHWCLGCRCGTANAYAHDLSANRHIHCIFWASSWLV